MSGSYNPLLVAVSIALAILASFTALNLASRIRVSEGTGRGWWLGAAALALGVGIWSMHFLGMLALEVHGSITYALAPTFISLLLPILFVGMGFAIVARFGPTGLPLTAAGLLAGLGIVAMHYVGMSAMEMPGSSTNYDPRLVMASVGIAILAATAAIWLTFRTQGVRERLCAAAVMGAAISGMHYTGMAAATYIHTASDLALTGHGIGDGVLAIAVGSATSLLMILGLLGAFFDRKLATLTVREASLLQQSEQRYRALVENASDIVFIIDRAGRVTYESASSERLLGYADDELVGQHLSVISPAGATDALNRFLAVLGAESDHLERSELRLRHENGSWLDFEVVGRNLFDEPAVAGIVLNLRDITERKQLLSALEHLSETDPLTGTLNRRGFFKTGEREIEQARGSGHRLSAVMLDIDHFKRVNDTHGHAAGDLVLSQVAKVCHDEIRAGDVLSRFGGEEFVILLADSTLEAAHLVVERLRLAIEGTRVHSIKGDVRVTASFGLATVDPRRCSLEAAIRLADEALYEAKNAGRNCIKVRAAA